MIRAPTVARRWREGVVRGRVEHQADAVGDGQQVAGRAGHRPSQALVVAAAEGRERSMQGGIARQGERSRRDHRRIARRTACEEGQRTAHDHGVEWALTFEIEPSAEPPGGLVGVSAACHTSMQWKWLRSSSSKPTPCTTAKRPPSHSAFERVRAGWRANPSPMPRAASGSMARLPRAHR